MAEKAQFARHYLISAFLHGETGLPISGTLRPLKYRYFTFKTPHGVSMVGTDDRGLTSSVDKTFKQLKEINLPAAKPWEVNLAPPGLLRQAYIALGEGWQAELVKLLQQDNFDHALKTLPAKFVRKDLHPEELELQEIKAHFKDGETYQAQIVPCTRLLSFLIPEDVLQDAPSTLSVYNVADPDEKVAFSRAPNPVHLAIGHKRPASFISYSSSGSHLKPGTYVVDCPASAFRPDLHRRFDSGAKLKRSFEVAFATTNLFSEFDFHVFDLPSVESALLIDFPERYPHILTPEAVSSSVPTEPEYAAAAPATLRFKASFAVAYEKQKMAVGAINAELSENAKTVVKAALESVSKAALAEGDQKVASAILSLHTVYESAKETAEKWKKLRIASENAKVLGLVESMVDGNLLQRLFLRTKWRDAVIDAIGRTADRAHDNRLGNYVVRFKDKINPVTLKTLVKSTASSRQSVLDQMVGGGQRSSRALSALDTAVTLEQTIALWNELWEKAGDVRVANERLSQGTRTYSRRFGSAPCLPAIERVVALRKLADAERLAYDEKQKEALKRSITLALKAAVHVPIASEFAQVALFAVDTWDAISTVATEIDKLIDSHLWRHRSVNARNRETAQLHAAQCEAIAEIRSSNPDADPAVQLRLRTMVLIGLVRLIERCGTRLPDEGRFKRKVEQYRISEYIENFITSGKKVSVPVLSGVPLDELWLYVAGNKNQRWTDEIYQENFRHGPPRWPTMLPEIQRHLAFQRFFPVHGVESKNAFELAKAFSLNFAGVLDHALCYTEVYVRRKPEDPWIALKQADFAITPVTPIRVCAIFKSKSDLTGTPVSLQLLRQELVFFESEGPVYKSALERTSLGDNGAVAGKFYLPGTPEARYASDDSAYACIFFPFYNFHGHTIQGLKPFGALSVSSCAELNYTFRLKVGDDEKTINIGGEGKLVKLEIPIQVPMFVDMILDNDFQENRTSAAKYGNLVLSNDNKDKAGIVGAFVRAGGPTASWHTAMRSASDTPFFANRVDAYDRAVPCDWGEPLELVVVAYARYLNQKSGWPVDHIRFPAWLQLSQEKGGILKGLRELADAMPAGPAYGVTLLSVDLERPVREVTAMRLSQTLRDPRLLGPKAPNLARDKDGLFRLPFPAYLFVAHVTFVYQLENQDGRFSVIPGLRPFSSDYPTMTAETYRLRLVSPDPVSFDTKDDMAIAMKPIPRDVWRGTAFAGHAALISGEVARKSLSIERALLTR
ncbi:MAG: hypothetical protein KA712_11995 [Myxococcales bacterium]|nr:hypothetical protein [Myxococcales bacterium]